MNRGNCDSFALSISHSLVSLLYLTLAFSVALFLWYTLAHIKHTFLIIHGELGEVEIKLKKRPLTWQGSIAGLMSNALLSLSSSVHLIGSLLQCCLHGPPLPGQ